MSARAAIHAMLPVLDSPAEANAREQELDKHLDALIVEALVKAGVQYVDCPVCGAAQPVGGECGTCAFEARMAAELAARGMVPAPAASPDFFQAERTYQHGDRVFRCDMVAANPNNGKRTAIGWSWFAGGYGQVASYTDAHWADDWTDVTEAGTR